MYKLGITSIKKLLATDEVVGRTINARLLLHLNELEDEKALMTFNRIIRRLELSNTCFKTTWKGRFDDIDEILVPVLRETFPQGPSVWDIGVSEGTTSVDLFRKIEDLPKLSLEMTDINEHIYIRDGRFRTDVCDDDGNLIQSTLGPFVIHTTGLSGMHRLVLINRILYHYLNRFAKPAIRRQWLRAQEAGEDGGFIKMSVLSPELQSVMASDRRVSFEKRDLFLPRADSFDFVRMMNVLNLGSKGYGFSEDDARRGLKAILPTVKEGGFLLIGRTTHTTGNFYINNATLYRKIDDEIRPVIRFGSGSEVEKLVECRYTDTIRAYPAVPREGIQTSPVSQEDIYTMPDGIVLGEDPVNRPISAETSPEGLRSRLIAGTAWNLLATVFNQGSTFAVNVVVARLLGKHVFGEYAMLQSTLLTVSGLVQLSLGYTSMKYVAEFRATNPARAGRILGMCSAVSMITALLGAVGLAAVAPWLATHSLKAAHLAPGLQIGAIFLLFSAINGYQLGVLSGLEGYRSLAKAGVLSGITAMAGISFGAWFGGLNGAMAGLALTAVCRCGYHNAWMRAELRNSGIKLRYDGYKQEKEIIYRFAIPAAISGYFTLPALWLSNAILVQQKNGYPEMALYSAATNIRLIVLFFPGVLHSVGLSILNNVKGGGDRARFAGVFRSNIMAIFLTSLTMVILLQLFGTTILKMFGKDFSEGKSILTLLLLSTILESLTIAGSQYITSHGNMWLSFLGINAPREILRVALAMWLAPTMGAYGMAWGYLICCAFALLSQVIIIQWHSARSEPKVRPEPVKSLS